MDNIITIILAAILVEAVADTLKMIVNCILKGKEGIKQGSFKLMTLLIGILICWNYSINLPKIMGFQNHYPIIGYLLTGTILSRGSKFVNDLIEMIERIRTKDNPTS